MRTVKVSMATAMLVTSMGGAAHAAESRGIPDELAITGVAKPSTVQAGRTLRLRWTVTNPSKVTHQRAKLFSALPNDWRQAPGSDARCEPDEVYPHTISCDLGRLAPGDKTAVRIKVQVPANAGAGSSEASASAYSERTPADAPAPTATVTVTTTR